MAITRREFIKANAAAAVGLAAGTAASGFPNLTAQKKAIRIGVVGTGNRGRHLLSILLGMEGVEVPALCDIQKPHLDMAMDMVVKAGQKKPEAYLQDEYTFKQLMDRDDLEAVIIASYWEWHAPMAVYAMKAGKYAGTEVPAAYTLDECWELIDTHEATGVPCMMLENWSHRRDNLAMLNMIRLEMLGEIVHCHCAHSHDCIDHWFFDPETGMDRWAAKYLLQHNRDQYPTHQLGPVISWMDIGCGDMFDTLTSTATDSFGINDYFIRRFGPDHPNAKRTYSQGDIVSTVIRTKKGKSIVINYDMQLPRPYDNRWMIQGTRGIYNEQRNAVYLTDHSPEYHEWEPFPPYQEKHDHAWWKAIQGVGSQYGHGGTDYLELKMFVEAVRNQTQTPIDVYESVIMSANGPLSEESIAKGSAPIKVPDFTRGKWKTRKPRFAVDAGR
ncbi:MAG: Gfo/Idh/MocA family oxidoreductase [Candidatus Aminicenantaceae bacterium]